MDNKSIFRGHELHDESLTELLKQLGGHSAVLVREEISLLRQEIIEKIHALRNSLILIATGVVLGVVALATLWASFIIWLTSFLAPEVAAAVTGGGLALTGLIIAFIGVKLWQKITITPLETMETLEGRAENG
jgi:hypothetical protein